MNFFKTVFLEDEDPSDSEETPINDPTKMKDPEIQEAQEDEVENDNQEEEEEVSSDAGPAWSFGGLMKTLATRSESVIQTYKRDLEEFGSGLKKETAVIREVASRAVKDLPGSLEVGASVAQESLESVGQAIDDFGNTVWKGTAEIITQGKESILSIDLDNSNNNSINSGELITNDSFSSGGNSKKYSRYEMQLRAIQCDENTYLEEPDDVEEYEKWKNGFVVDEKGEEIMNLMGENEVMEGVYKKVVPNMVDRERFWSRYFYKVFKLQQAEDARAKLVKRAISGDDEEEDLSWDIEDDEEEVEEKDGIVAKDVVGENEKKVVEEAEVSGREKKSDEEVTKKYDGVGEIVKSEMKSDAPEENTGNAEEKFCEEKVGEGKLDQGDSCKDSDVSIVSTQPSLPEEEDLGWDEIEDIGSDDDNKTAASANLPKVYLRKRLSAAEEEEDLSWDIEEEDDVEPVKS